MQEVQLPSERQDVLAGMVVSKRRFARNSRS